MSAQHESAAKHLSAKENSLVAGPTYTIHARARVLELFAENDVDRLAQQACDAAAKFQGWGPGEEFVFEIKDEPYSYPGVEPSLVIVCHKADKYEVFFYHGPMAETIQEHCSWDVYKQSPPSEA